MNKAPKTDLIEAEYWDGDLNVRDLFTKMREMEVEMTMQLVEKQKTINCFSAKMTMALMRQEAKLSKDSEQLAAERARTKELTEAIQSILPDPPYHPLLEPEWVYLSELVNKGEESSP